LAFQCAQTTRERWPPRQSLHTVVGQPMDFWRENTRGGMTDRRRAAASAPCGVRLAIY